MWLLELLTLMDVYDAEPCIGLAGESAVGGLNWSLLIVVTLLLPSSVGPFLGDAYLKWAA